MRNISTFVLLSLLAAAPARAALLDASFSGTVNTQQGTSFAPGDAISAAFEFDTVRHTFNAFTIGGVSIQAPFDSTVSTSPGLNPFSALFTAQASPVQLGSPLNQTFTLDLEAATTFPTDNPVALLVDPNLLSELDPSLTHFGFYIANPDGTNIRSVDASLSLAPGSFSVTTTVPEPASFALLLAPALGFVALRRR